MTMDNGEGRPLDELESGHEDPQGWYFDLPSDAWKRQEEKNRLLRERLRQGSAEPAEPERRDPFVLRRPEPEPPKKRGLFGLGRKKRENEAERPAGRRVEPQAGRPGWLTADDGDADEWSTERVAFDAPAEESALRLRPRVRDGEPDAPTGAERVVPPAAPPVEPPPLRLRSRTEPEQGSRLNWDFGPGAWPETPARGGAEPPVDSPEDEESIFARMQAWAERGREEQHRRLGLGHRQDSEGEEGVAAHRDDAAPDAASQWPGGAAQEPLLPGEHHDRRSGEPDHGPGLPPLRLRREPVDAPREERTSSNWDEFFGLNREDGKEEGPGFSEGLAAMREWAKKKPLGDDIREIPEEFLKPFDWELEEQGQAGGHAQQEDPFAAFRVSGEPEPGADREAGAPTWADGQAQQDDPFAAFRVSSDAEPVADREAGGADDDDPLAGIFVSRDVSGAPGTPKEKRGLFGRLFGRKRHDEPTDTPLAPAERDWVLEPGEAAPGEPARAADAPGEWIAAPPAIAGRGDGTSEQGWGTSAGPTLARDWAAVEEFAAEVRAQDAPVTAWTPGSTRADERLAVDDEAVSFDRPEEAAEDEEWAPEPVPLFQAPPEPGRGAGPAAVVEPQAAPDDDEEWAPEPVPPFEVPLAAGGTAAGTAAEATSTAQNDEGWTSGTPALSPSEFGAAVQAAFWSAPADEPGAPAVERPWWEAPEAGETVEEAVASAEPAVVSEPEVTPAAERPWWEAPEAEEAVETVETVAGTGPDVAGEPEVTQAAERPWWEAPEAEETVETVAGTGPDVADEPGATAAERPWWERPAGFEPPAAWTHQEPAAAPGEDSGSDDMWGDIAETAELAATGSGDAGALDLAASLEAQLGAALEEPAWPQPSPAEGEDDAFRSTEDEGDVILKAFEAHASTPDPEEDAAEAAALEAETAAALSALFGENATEIVAGAGEEPAERPFIRLGAWAPQRSLPADDGWAPEEEVRQELEARTNPFGFALDPLAGTPPWLGEAEAGEDERPERAGSDGKLKAWVREVVETVMLAALVFLSVRASFGNFKVDGNSMYPTLENGEFLIVNKLVYSEVDLEKLSNFLPFIDPGSDPTRYVFHGPERGDIIVLRDPRDPSTDLIKRVIGLPGETIEIVNGKVYINDRLLEEPYITTPWNDSLPKILIPPDEYFVMGDNRNNSLDSRSAQVGLVSKDLIIGKATLTYLPLNRFGLAPNQKGVLTEQKPVLTTKRIGEE